MINDLTNKQLSPHYTMRLGCVFGKVCEQKREQKPEKNATDSRFYSMHSVIQNKCLAVFLRWVIFLRFHSRFNASETKHSVIRPLLFSNRIWGDSP